MDLGGMHPAAPTGSLSPAAIRANARKFVAENPPPPLSDEAIVKLRALFDSAPVRAAAA